MSAGDNQPKPRKCGAYTRRRGEWRTLEWLPGYEISEDGFVRTLIQRSSSVPAGTIFSGCVDSNGYRKFKLTTSTGVRQLKAHSLVAEAWHGPRDGIRCQVAHNDGDRLNNHYTNLRWATAAENLADRVAHGTDPSGERNPRALLNWEAVREIRSRYAGKRGEIAALSREFGVSHGAMRAVLDGRHWRE